jgi:hypothetical protein
MSDWKAGMQEALASGYQTGNRWEILLRKHMENHLPALTKELKATGDFEGYLVAQVQNAYDQRDLMIEQGMRPDEANSQALADLFPTPPEEVIQTPPWVRLAGVDDSLRGQIDYLLSLERNGADT